MNDQIYPLSPDQIAVLNLAIVAKGYRLEYQNSQLQLVSLNQAFKPLSIDFIEGSNRHRRLFGGGKGQPLARAIGLKKGNLPTVLDVTAGLGRDAFVLATLGCQVVLLERSPEIAALLQDALRRAMEEIEIRSVVQRMQVIYDDSLDYLHVDNKEAIEVINPDVIYMDPMYPHRDKSALVKKEMRIFRDLVGEDTDSADLLDACRNQSVKKIVVKRPKGAEPVGGQKPHAQVSSKNTRYDIYLPTN